MKMNALHARQILEREGRPLIADVLGDRNGYRHSPNSLRYCSKCYGQIILHGRLGWLHCESLEHDCLDAENVATCAR